MMRAALVALVAIGVAPRVDARPFDLGACASDLVAGKPAPASLADGPHERGGPPPRAMTAFALADARAVRAIARAVAAALPPAWSPHVEVDATGMATAVTVSLPGTRTAAKLAAEIAAFVRAHACLFGVLDPDQLSTYVHVERFVYFDVRPHAIGALSATVRAVEGRTEIAFEGHLWPVAEPTAAFAEKRVLARYLGRRYEEVLHMYGDLGSPHPAPHGIAYKHPRTTVESFKVARGPMLVCTGRTLVVRDGAYVELLGRANGDSVLADLPAALDATGRPLRGFIAPILFDPDARYTDADRADERGRACLAR